MWWWRVGEIKFWCGVWCGGVGVAAVWASMFSALYVCWLCAQCLCVLVGTAQAPRPAGCEND
eukprot:scaffold3553_cov180-Ochromonas_danica.AAC.5